MPRTLFEVSWEVCNKVGGIHTVVSTKARTLVERYGDNYITIGPWLLGESRPSLPFDDEDGYEGFAESCRQLGVAVRIGRWRIPGRPLTLLVQFSRLFEQKDRIFAALWEHHRVDSLFGGWDYVEPAMFGHAAGLVIEKWWREFIAPLREEAVAQFHEWMTASGLLYLKTRVPRIGTVFTTHATVLGRALSAHGHALRDVEARGAQAVAADLNVRSKHSLESVAAREADVFTTVSEITASEATLCLGRAAQPVLPNGIDLEVMDHLAGPTPRAEVRARIERLVRTVTGSEVPDARLVATSGRYEVHNKGLDVFLRAGGMVNRLPGRPVVLLVLVPAASAGLRKEVLDRYERDERTSLPTLGIATHHLFDPEHDPVHRLARDLGLANEATQRVHLVQVPVYLDGNDGLLNLPYEAVVRATDLTCFPSLYEPWGYTPIESLALGVPTVTTDCAGYGLWARRAGLGPEGGVHILAREGRGDEEAAADLAHIIDEFVNNDHDPVRMAEICRKSSQPASWSDLIVHYEEAFRLAGDAARARWGSEAIAPVVPRPRMPVSVASVHRPRITRFEVTVTLPESLAGLERLARNYAWSWDADAPGLFEELAPDLWRNTQRNPVLFLRTIPGALLEARARDAAWLKRLEAVMGRFDEYVGAGVPELSLANGKRLDARRPIAYFCLEYALHESLPIYSGGLGVLAGDHLKSASDAHLPLIAVGLWYRKGYVQQRLSTSAEQIALDVEHDPRVLPMELVRDAAGKRIDVVIEAPSSNIVVQAWEVKVGRVRLYLLDTDLPENRPEDRALTHHLYAADPETRLRQEILLGKGGIRMLDRMGIEPAVLHLNEGHAAFAPLERIAQLVHGARLTFDEARAHVAGTTVFTTHTPVPAGHDVFTEDLMRRHFSDTPTWIGLPWERFIALGNADDGRTHFNMSYLALHVASIVNAVSRRHCEVTRKLVSPCWSALLPDEVPVHYVTNGVHLPTWTSREMAALLGVEGRPVKDTDFARAAPALAPEDLWRVRGVLKHRLLADVRRRTEQSFLERQDSPRLLPRITAGLDPRALVIGFARRFAPYKRAYLLLLDRERLLRLVSDDERPVRLLFAGKAHPNDRMGCDILRNIVELSRSDAFAGKVFFVENYDLAVARAFVQGVDLWLNTPVRPQEASGTSGMKVAANGGLNLSVLDGWWSEGSDGTNGWVIHDDDVYPDQERQDQLVSASLLGLLEEEIIPLYFERDARGVPLGWLDRVRRSLGTIPPRFNTHRMVEEYRDLAYAPLGANASDLAADGHATARALAAENQRVARAFQEVKILGARIVDLSTLKTGDVVEVHVMVDMGQLTPDDLRVEMVLGHLDGPSNLRDPEIVQLRSTSPRRRATCAFTGQHAISSSGSYGYGIRVRPRPIVEWDHTLSALVLWA